MVSAGATSITGGMVSSTVTIWVAETAFPQSSLAVQVRVMVSRFTHDESEITSEKLTGTNPQLSDAFTVEGSGTSSIQVTVVSFGINENCGLIESTT